MSKPFTDSRRAFLKHAATAAAVASSSGVAGKVHARGAPAFISADRPLIETGLQIGDVCGDRALIWSRADRASRMLVEWSTTPAFHRSTRVRGPHALEVSGYTARVDLTNLPADQDIFVRVSFENLENTKAESERIIGQFRTAPRSRRDVRFVWTGDTAGQGYGSNPEMGGMKLYRSMMDAEPDFFIHSGDTIYADGPLAKTVTLADGTTWHNDFLDKVPSKMKVAETLDDFRGCYIYNMLDPNVRAFNARVPQIWQWDDHEVVNNWAPGKDLSGDARYAEKRVPTLVGRGTRAFLEFSPQRWNTQEESERIYRRIPYSRDVEVFVLDMRSYRGPNTNNLQPSPGAETTFLGAAQLQWLKESLRRSRATWKVIAADMPLGLNVGDGKLPDGQARWEAVANGNDGPALGRELEIAGLLRFIKYANVKNVVWFTADVHYTAAHYYDPAKAKFQDFEPFWEFVSGPANAGTFGPNTLDATFGPQVVFQKAPPPGQSNLPPSAGLQFFGQVDIDPRARDMLVSLRDINGSALFTQRLESQPCSGWRDDD